MGNTLHITSPMPPSVNHYAKHRAYIKNGKPMAVVYETKEAKDYKKEMKSLVEAAISGQKWDLPVNSTQHFYVDAYYYFDRIDKDASNYEKCLCDAITETQKIWKDDNVVLYRVQRIQYDTKDPRIELYIKPVSYVGIFDTEEDYGEMIKTCQACKKYDRCRIIEKAKEGRITGNIEHTDDGYRCNRYSSSKKKGEYNE